MRDPTKGPLTVIGLIELLKTFNPNSEVVATWETVSAPLFKNDFEEKDGILWIDAEAGYLESRQYKGRV